MDTIPWLLVFSQIVNLAILFCLYFFFLRKKVSLFFSNREKSFLSQKEKSKALVLEAKKENEHIRSLLIRVEKIYDGEIKKAKENAQAKKEGFLKEVKEEADEILRRGEKKIHQEEQRVLRILKEELLSRIFSQVKSELPGLLSPHLRENLELHLLNYFRSFETLTKT